jgi:hypothetical protein
MAISMRCCGQHNSTMWCAAARRSGSVAARATSRHVKLFPCTASIPVSRSRFLAPCQTSVRGAQTLAAAAVDAAERIQEYDADQIQVGRRTSASTFDVHTKGVLVRKGVPRHLGCSPIRMGGAHLLSESVSASRIAANCVASPVTTASTQVLEGLDPVRKRPGMYIGSTGQRGLHHLVYEVLDNSIDEVQGGHASVVTIDVDLTTGWVAVRDNGRGIPTGFHPKTGCAPAAALAHAQHPPRSLANTRPSNAGLTASRHSATGAPPQGVAWCIVSCTRLHPRVMAWLACSIPCSIHEYPLATGRPGSTAVQQYGRYPCTQHSQHSTPHQFCRLGIVSATRGYRHNGGC